MIQLSMEEGKAPLYVRAAWEDFLTACAKWEESKAAEKAKATNGG